MSGGGIYLISGENDLVEMTERRFDTEDLFQVLLAKYPRVLGGDHFDREAPRKWLLVTREAPIPAEEEGADRWSVDHLFVDEDAVPTFVEVKRSSDTRIRREVVGQMLDYVAHAIATWRTERLRNYFEAQCGSDPAEAFRVVMGSERDIEDFWQAVNTNLQAGKVRLVFVAEEIPPELRRVIEFLNKQMSPAEVLGIEIRQYVGGDFQTLVPRVIGQTAETEVLKGSARGARWTADRFFAELAKRDNAAEYEVARDLLAFAPSLMGRPIRPDDWGTGKTRGSFVVSMIVGGDRFSLFALYTIGGYTVNIGWNHANSAKTIANQYKARIAETLGFDISDSSRWWNPAESIMGSLESLAADQARSFKQLMLEMAADIKKLEVDGASI